MSKKQNNPWFEVRAADTGPVEILIYDQIGKDWWTGDGVEAKAFAEALKDIPRSKEIVVAINSPGGNVWDGLAIYHQLKARGDKLTTRVDGVAASIASIIALAGHEVQIPANALFMIHDPWGFAQGTADDMEKMRDELEKHAELLANIYAGKTGLGADKVRALMKDETWFSGAEAVAIGLADRVTDEIAMAALSKHDLSRFRRVPNANASAKPPTHQDTKPKTEKMKEPENNNGGAPVATAPPVEEPKAAAKPAENPNAATDKRIKELEANLKAERDARITGEFNALLAANPSIDAEKWLPRALADESILADLRAIPAPVAGAEPINGGRVQNDGNPIIEAHKALEHSGGDVQAAHKRREWLKANHGNLIAAKTRFAPQAANSFGASLVTDYLADGLVITAHNRLAALNVFTRDFGVDRIKPRSTVQVRKVTGGATGSQNPTNFESGDSTTTNIGVTVNQENVNFHVTNDELNKGHQLAHLATKNAQVFADQISDLVTALMVSGNYGAATVIGAASAFDADDLKPIMALAKDYPSKNLLLDGGHLAYLLPTDKDKFRIGEEGAYGFDIIAEQNRWTSAEANAAGFVCGPDSIAVASGLPVDLPAGEFLEMRTVELKNGLTVQLCVWFSRAGRVHWASYDVMFGAAAGDTTQAEVLVTA